MTPVQALEILGGVIRNEAQIGLAHRAGPGAAKPKMDEWFEALSVLRECVEQASPPPSSAPSEAMATDLMHRWLDCERRNEACGGCVSEDACHATEQALRSRLSRPTVTLTDAEAWRLLFDLAISSTPRVAGKVLRKRLSELGIAVAGEEGK